MQSGFWYAGKEKNFDRKGWFKMIFRQLCPNQFDAFTETLAKTGQSQPLDASYTVCITVDGDEYRLKVQPCQRNKVAVLQGRADSNNRAGANLSADYRKSSSFGVVGVIFIPNAICSEGLTEKQQPYVTEASVA